MKKSKYSNKIARFAKKAIFTTTDTKKAGIPSSMLPFFCNKGLIERISRGVYKGLNIDLNMDWQWEDLVLITKSIPRGIICLISALCYYNMTDQIMRDYWIAIPHSHKRLKRPNTRIVQMRNTTLGVKKIKIGNQWVKIFDEERTVVDAFRLLSDEIAIQALKAYIFEINKKADFRKLSRYAGKLRVNITPYIKALIA